MSNIKLYTNILLLVLGTNIIALGLLLEQDIVTFTGGLLLVIALGFTIIWTIRSKVDYDIKERSIEFEKSWTTKFWDLMSVTVDYLRINRAYLLISLLGLSIAVVALSQSFLLADSTKIRFIEERFTNEDLPGLVINLEAKEIFPTLDAPVMTMVDSIDSLNSIVYQTADTINPDIPITGTSTMIKIQELTYWDPQVLKYKSIEILGLSQRDFQFLYESFDPTIMTTNGSTDLTSSDAIIINYPRLRLPNAYTPDPSTTLEINLYKDYLYQTDDGGIYANTFNLSQQLDITGVITLNTTKFPYNPYVTSSFANFAVVVSLDRLVNIRQNFNYMVKAEIYQAYYFQTDKYKPEESLPFLTTVQNRVFLEKHKVDLEQDYYFMKSSSSPLRNEYAQIVSLFEPVKQISRIGVIPIIAMTVFLIVFSTDLVEMRKRHLIGIMKTRGISMSQLIWLLLTEIIATALLSTIFGAAISLPLAQWLSRSTGFLEFGHHAISTTLSYMNLLAIFAVAFSIALDLSILPMFNLVNLEIIDSTMPAESQDPFWKKYYLDAATFFVGLTFGLIPNVIGSTVSARLYTILLLFSIPISLFGITIGGVLLLLRLFSPTMNFIAEFLWKRHGTLVAFSLKSLTIRSTSRNKLISLIMITLLFLVTMGTLPTTLDQHALYQSEYELGADFVVWGIPHDAISLLPQVKQIDGVVAATPVRLLTYTHYIGGDDENQISMLGIDPETYSQVAYFRHDWAEFSLNNLPKYLQEKSDALIWNRDAARLLYAPGSILPLTYTNKTDASAINIQFEITEEFNYWPRLVPDISMPKGIRMITTINMTDFVNDIIFRNARITYATYIYMKLAPNANYGYVADQIEDLFGTTTTTLHYDNIEIHEQRANMLALLKIIPALVNLAFIMAIVQATIGIVSHALLTISARKREIGLLRSLGMVQWQLFFMFLMEIATILFVGVLVGLALGLLLAQILLPAFAIPDFIGALPPLIPIYDWHTILLSAITVTIIGFIGGIFPAFRYATYKPGDILRVE